MYLDDYLNYFCFYNGLTTWHVIIVLVFFLLYFLPKHFNQHVYLCLQKVYFEPGICILN